MTEPVEKSKRKNKPRVDRYSQNEAFAVMVMAFTIMLIFFLPHIISAVTIWPLLPSLTIAICTILASLFFFILARWTALPGPVAATLAIISIVAILGAGFSIFIMAWFIPITIFLIVPIIFFALLALVIFVIAKLGKRENVLISLRFPMKVLAFLLLPSAANIILFISYWSIPMRLMDAETTDSHAYHLVKDNGFLDPVQLELYKCNHLSINCERVYYTYDDFGPSFYFHESQDTVEMDQGDDDNVLVILNGEVVFDSSEGGKE